MSRDEYTKHPDDVLDYVFDWADWLSTDADTIVDSDITVTPATSPALAIDDPVPHITLPTNVRVWCSSGLDGQRYIVRNRITTAGGRTKTSSITISVTSKVQQVM
jgi:hypothetical protein